MPRDHAPPVTLLRVRDVTERLGLGRATVFKLINAGELEPLHLGTRTLRIPSDSVDAYIERARKAEKKRATETA